MTSHPVHSIPRARRWARGASLFAASPAQLQRPGHRLAAVAVGLWLAALAPAQDIHTIAGSGAVGFSGDGGLATAAGISSPRGIAVDAGGNVYFCDSGNHRVRRVDAITGIISTVAGISGIGGFNGDGQSATTARLRSPSGLAFDASGNLFIADTGNHRVRRIDAVTERISTVAGTGVFGFGGDGGPATSAQTWNPRDVAVDGAGNVFFSSESNHRVRRVDMATGTIETVAGTGNSAYNGDHQPATSASLSFPYGIALDAAGNLLIADSNNFRVRAVDLATGIITTVAGDGTSVFGGDGGSATSAQLRGPLTVAVLASGEFVIGGADGRVRAVDSNGVIRTVAGDGTNGFSGDGGPAIQAGIGSIDGLGVGVHGDIYLAANSRIRRVGDNRAPTANAGDDLSVTVPSGQAAQLDGSASTDDLTPNTGLLYAWTLVGTPGGSTASLSGANTANPSFVPDLDGDYTAELVVTDAAGLQSAPDQVLISIAVDDPPVAHAGDDQLGFTGTAVTFDGGLSTDDLTASGNLLYAWTIVTQPAGSAATLSGAMTATPSLVPDLGGDYVVQLVVTDESGQASPADETILTASEPNAAPTADAGSAATAATNVALQLDGTGSSDPDLDALTYQWALASAPTGSQATLAMASTATPTLTPDLPGTYVVELIVNDGFVDSPASSVEIEAIDGSSYAQSKIRDVDALVASLPLTDFYGSGGSGNSNSCRQSQRARISKLLLRLQLRLAAWQVQRLDRAVQCGASSHQISGRQRDALRAIQKVLVNVDGWAERGAADERGSGFRHDLLISAGSAVAAYDCLEQARVAVEAIQ